MKDKQTIKVSLVIEATGVIDQDLLDHLGVHAEGDFRECKGLGHATPNEGPNAEKYEETELELVAVESEIVEDNGNPRAAALIEFKERLAKGGTIADLDAMIAEEVA